MRGIKSNVPADKCTIKVYIQRTAHQDGSLDRCQTGAIDPVAALHRPHLNYGLPGQPRPDVVIGLFNARDSGTGMGYAKAFSTAAMCCNTSGSPRSAQYTAISCLPASTL